MGWKTNLVVEAKAIRKGERAVKKTAEALRLLKVTYEPIDSLRPNLYNPNRQSEHEWTLLKKSMQDDGVTQPILVQQDTRQIIDGEHRWRMAKELGFTEIPVVFTTMTPEQMRVATLRHNRARGEENVELTAELLRDLQQMGSLEWAQKALELEDIEIQRLIDDIPAPEALAGEEFSKPWQPIAKGSENLADAISMTVEAADHLREMEDKVRRAKTLEEKKQAEKDSRVYRINLVYTDAEAHIVRKVLGKNAAQKVLTFCRQELKVVGD